VALAEWIQRIRNEAALQQVAGATDDDLGDWLLGELRKILIDYERRESLAEPGTGPGS
jgi:hypothetical protein